MDTFLMFYIMIGVMLTIGGGIFAYKNKHILFSAGTGV
jgi:hypothetical protein